MSSPIKSKTLIITLLVLACLLVGYFFLLPLYRKADEVRQLLAQAETEKANLSSAETEMDNFLKEYQSLSGDQKLVDLALPTNDLQLSSLLANLENLAKSSGLSLANLRLREKDTTQKALENAIDYADLDLEASGTYPGLKNFWLLLESNLRIIDVQEINVQVEENDIIQFQLFLRAYYQK